MFADVMRAVRGLDCRRGAGDETPVEREALAHALQHQQLPPHEGRHVRARPGAPANQAERRRGHFQRQAPTGMWLE